MPGMNAIELIERLEKGEFVKALTEKLEETGSGLRSHQIDYGGEPTASLTIKLNFKADSNNLLVVTTQLDNALPKEPKRARTILWIDGGGKFQVQDPAQQVLFPDQRPVRTV